MKNGIKFVAITALALLAVACSQKDPAQAAVTAAEDALAAISEDALKYVPDQYGEVKASLDEARGALNEERYKDAIAAVKDVPARAEAVATAAATAKQAFMETLNSDWANLAGGLPGQISAIGSRLAELGKMRRLPKGMDAAMLTEANTIFTTAQDSWNTASAAFGAGDLEAAVARAHDVHGTLQGLMTRLGMSAG